MGPRKRGLTPAKVIAIYFMAFLLVAAHESGRILTWLEGACLKWDSAPIVLEYCQKIREVSGDIGVEDVLAAERRVLDYRSQLPMLGEKQVAAAEPVSSTKADSETVVTSPVVSEPPRPESPAVVIRSEAGMTASLAFGGEATPGYIVDIGSSPQPALSRPVPESPPELLHMSPTTMVETASLEKPSPKATGATQPAKITRIKPKKVLIAGDSMILEGFGVALERALKKFPGLSVVRAGKYSTGLSRPDYFDWMPYLRELVQTHAPDVLIVSLGANDPQDIVDENRKRHIVATESWNTIYAARAEAFLSIPREKGILTFWVGLPIMGRKKYGKRIANLNAIVQKTCEKSPRSIFIDAWYVLSDKNKKYTTFIKNEKGRHIRIRAKDLIHLTEAGGEIMTRYFIDKAGEWIEWPIKEKKSAPGEEPAKTKTGHSPQP